MRTLGAEQVLPIVAVAGISYGIHGADGMFTFGGMASAAAAYLGSCILAGIVLSKVQFRPTVPTLSAADSKRLASGKPKGCTNWRDLGGIETKDGRMKLKTGIAYRSGELCSLDLASGAASTLKTVVDLRDKTELASKPDNLPSGAKLLHLSFSFKSLGELKGLKGLTGANLSNLVKFRPAWLFGNGMEVLQKALTQHLITNPNQESNIGKLIKGIGSEPDTFLPFDMHCREGKDRCGAMVALLLLALGVSERDVLSDFLVTNAALAKKASKRMFVLRIMWLVTGSWYAALFYTRPMWLLLLVEEPVMALPFGIINKEYGGFNQKFWDIKGVSEQDLRALKDAMLEPV
eukprot:gene8903-9742_t